MYLIKSHSIFERLVHLIMLFYNFQFHRFYCYFVKLSLFSLSFLRISLKSKKKIILSISALSFEPLCVSWRLAFRAQKIKIRIVKKKKKKGGRKDSSLSIAFVQCFQINFVIDFSGIAPDRDIIYRFQTLYYRCFTRFLERYQDGS